MKMGFLDGLPLLSRFHPGGGRDVWIGLFTHVDSVSRGTLDLLLQLKGLGITEHGKEYFVDETKFRTIDKLIERRSMRVGGNAGNAAYFLGKLGVGCNLSAPVRPAQLMEFFHGLPVSFWGTQRKNAEIAARDDPSFEHLVIELFPPLSNYKRTIISWDPMTREGWLDQGFWNHMDRGILLLSGLHLVENKGAVEDVVARMKGKRVKTYLELGEPGETLKHALDRLLEEDLVHHIGMNEREASAMFGAGPADAAAVTKETGCGVTIHTTEFTASTEKAMLRPLTDMVEAWAMGGPSYYRQVTTLPLKQAPKGAVPARSLPFMERATGLGDAFAALDAIRVFDPKRMEKLVRRFPFHGAD
jgi:hypothetical protein